MGADFIDRCWVNLVHNLKRNKMEEIKKLRFAEPDFLGWEFNIDLLMTLKAKSEEEVELEQIQSLLIALCDDEIKAFEL